MLDEQSKRLLKAFVTGRFSILLLSVTTFFFVGSLVPKGQFWVDKTLAVLNLLVLLSCLRAVARNKRVFIFMTIYSVVYVSLGSLGLFSKDGYLFQGISLGIGIVYYLIVFLIIMRYVLSEGAVTTDKICGALSAYLLLAILWSHAYSLIYLLNPESFSIPDGLVSVLGVSDSWSIYFSFTTMTALGYGDITPQTPAAQSYAVMQAAMGQMYVAVILARLIALQITHEADKKREIT